MTDQITLTVNGRRYDGWTDIRVSRGIDRCVGDFEVEVSERWSGEDAPWRILPFDACAVWVGEDLVLTGYIDDYEPSFTPTTHKVSIRGRSKTQDLVDCTPDIRAGQYNGYTLAAIAASICGIFGIQTVVQTDGARIPMPSVQIERCETAFQFLERLGRLCGVLLTDDPLGRLVLTTAGQARASGALIQGMNVQQATGKISGQRRFSSYTVKGQAGLAVGVSGSAGAAGTASKATTTAGVVNVTPTQSSPAVPSGGVQTQLEAVALDTTVPRFRPRVVLAESQMTLQQLQRRADWMASYAAGRATEAEVTVPGWRQPDGTLWTANQIVPVSSVFLGVDQDLLVVAVQFALNDHGGHITRLTVGPVEGYTPDPGQVRTHRERHDRHHRGSGIDWSGVRR